MKNKAGGYILLETCLAIVFLSVGITMVITAMMSSLKGIRFSQNYFLSGYLLEEKVGEDRMTHRVDDGSRDIFSWTITKEQNEEKKLEERTMTVTWMERDRLNSQNFFYAIPYENEE